MALIRWEPKREMDSFRSLRDEVDRLFDEFFQGWTRPMSGSLWAPFRTGVGAAKEAFAPSVSLKETNDEFLLTAEIPGLTKEEIEITLTEDSVALKGERREEKDEKSGKGSYLYRETIYGAFQRSIPLPAPIKPEEAKAQLKEGVLTLTLPKAEAGKRKAINVKVG